MRRPPALLTLAALLVALLVPVALAGPASSSAQEPGATSSGAHGPAKAGKSGKAGTSGKAGKVRKPGKAGKSWPKGRVRYLDLTDDHEAVRAATRIWNTSGLGVKFMRVKKSGTARLVLRDVPDLASGCGTGRATAGYPGARRRAVVEVRSGPDSAGQRCAMPGQTLTLVRLLGRVLGLKDDDGGCAAMNSSHLGGIAPSRCEVPADVDPTGHWMCSPLTSRDLAKAKRRYGGSPRPVPADPWCSLVEPMPATGSVTVREVGGELMAYLQRLPEPEAPSYLAKDEVEPEWEVHQTVGGCTAVAGGDASYDDGDEWYVEPGEVEEIELFPMHSGTVCFTFFALDSLGGYARTGSSAVVQVAPGGALVSALPG